jgi:methylenetetrahydrofolate dehydrogenase (NADP+)/methenyltetrahydrofolate cyclohydrolase
VQQLLVRTGVEIEGAHVVVVGRSNLVGRPLSVLLSIKAEHANATVTLCHTRTRELERITKQADILIVAAGVPKMIGADHVSEGTVVIDVGTTVTPDGAYLGDVDFEAVSQKVRAISPVPGGVGPMTRAMLIANTVRAAELLSAS